MSANDGGPAFPTTPNTVGGVSGGMSLRDWFAGQALQGLMAHNGHSSIKENAVYRASHCYGYADAMLKERDK